MREQMLKSVSEHGRCDIGVVDLSALNRKPLDQLAQLFGDEPGAFQNVKSRSKGGDVSEDSRVVRQGGLCGSRPGGHGQVLTQDLNANVKIGSLFSPLFQLIFGGGLKRGTGVAGEDQNVRIDEQVANAGYHHRFPRGGGWSPWAMPPGEALSGATDPRACRG